MKLIEREKNIDLGDINLDEDGNLQIVAEDTKTVGMVEAALMATRIRQRYLNPSTHAEQDKDVPSRFTIAGVDELQMAGMSNNLRVHFNIYTAPDTEE